MHRMTTERAERYVGAVTRMNESLTEEEVENLAEMLQTKPMVKALGLVWHTADGFKDQLVEIDLATQEQVLAATRIQGRRHGVMLFMQLLLALATEGEIEE